MIIRKIRLSYFLKNTLNYISGEVLTKGIHFLSIPLFSFLLTPSQYGDVALFVMMYPILGTFMSLNLPGYIRQGILKKEDSIKKIVGAVLAFQLLALMILSPLFFLFKEEFSSFLELNKNIVSLVFVTALFSIFYQCYQFYLLGHNESGKYALFSLISAILNIGLSVAFIQLFNKSADIERIKGITFCFFIMGGYAIISLLRCSQLIINKDILKKALSFSVPLIFHAVAGLLLAQSDRLMIKKIIGVKETGLYSYAYNAGMVMQVLVIASNNSWIPTFYNYLNNKDYERISKTMRKYVQIMLLITVVLMVIIIPSIRLITDSSYYDGMWIIPIIILSGFVILLNNLYANYTFYEGSTIIISINTLIAASVNIGMNYFFLEDWGYKSAAYTTLISYVVLFGLNYFYARKFNKYSVVSVLSLFSLRIK